MNKHFLVVALALVLLTALVVMPRFADAQDDVAGISAVAEGSNSATIFQAAGPTAVSIQSSLDQFRQTIGAQNNGNGPSADSGRREINWDGGSTTNEATSVAGNPFAGFLITRGALFTTPDGTGFVQAPASADPILFPPGGLAGLFNNPVYGATFQAFSPSRLF